MLRTEKDSLPAELLVVSQKIQRIADRVTPKISKNEYDEYLRAISELEEVCQTWAAQYLQKPITTRFVKSYTLGLFRILEEAFRVLEDECCVAYFFSDSINFACFHDEFTSYLLQDSRCHNCEYTSLASSTQFAYNCPRFDVVFLNLRLQVYFVSILSKDGFSKDFTAYSNEVWQFSTKEDHTVRALHGVRVTEEILRLVPKIETFREALRGILFWASRNNFLSEFGYLDDLSITIMLTRVQQWFPEFPCFGLICKFFEIFRRWNFETDVCQVQAWNPSCTHVYRKWHPVTEISLTEMLSESYACRVLTPGFPEMNSACGTSLERWLQEQQSFCSAFRWSMKILVGNSRVPELFDWKRRVDRLLKEYESYIVIDIYSISNTDVNLVQNYFSKTLRESLMDYLTNYVVGGLQFFRLPIETVLTNLRIRSYRIHTDHEIHRLQQTSSRRRVSGLVKEICSIENEGEAVVQENNIRQLLPTTDSSDEETLSEMFHTKVLVGFSTNLSKTFSKLTTSGACQLHSSVGSRKNLIINLNQPICEITKHFVAWNNGRYGGRVHVQGMSQEAMLDDCRKRASFVNFVVKRRMLSFMVKMLRVADELRSDSRRVDFESCLTRSRIQDEAKI